MPCQFTLDPDHALVTIRCSGSLDAARLRASVAEARTAMQGHPSPAMLLDCRGLASAAMAPGWLQLPELLSEAMAASALEPVSCRCALVVAGGAADFALLQTVARNRSHGVRVFFEERDALDWLLRFE